MCRWEMSNVVIVAVFFMLQLARCSVLEIVPREWGPLCQSVWNESEATGAPKLVPRVSLHHTPGTLPWTLTCSSHWKQGDRCIAFTQHWRKRLGECDTERREHCSSWGSSNVFRKPGLLDSDLHPQGSPLETSTGSLTCLSEPLLPKL